MRSDGQPVASPTARKYLRIHLADNIGPIRLSRLLERFGSVDELLSASQARLRSVEGVGPACAEALIHARTDDRADRELALAESLKLRILCPQDPEYPAPLSRIPDRPTCLYVRGELRREDAASIAVVGTRRCTLYGSEQAQRFAALLSGAGFTVVSGLARGIDGYAHQGALRAGGRTIAVLGNGLTEIYPPEHGDLARSVAESGALVSEVPLQSAPDRKNFPQRNRIIVGLSAGVLVVEAGDTSGALISARLAIEYNREVFTLPGRIDTPQAAGTNRLIRDSGAKLVTCLEDILDELHVVERRSTPPSDAQDQGLLSGRAEPAPGRLSPDEQAVLDALGPEEIPLGTVCDTCRLPVHRITSALMTLQLKGLVVQSPGDRYSRRYPAPGK